ncbi:MAG: DUF547 domain-containing protein [Phycisphaerae bacterium]
MIRTSGYRRSLPLTLTITALVTGCASKTIQPTASTIPRPTPNATTPFDWSSWSLTLSRAVVGDEIDYARLLRDPAPLDQFLAQIARVGPATTPAMFQTRPDRLAYLVNAYNATILRSVLESARDGRLPPDIPLALETRFRFAIDGHMKRPTDLRRSALAIAGDDWRLRFALCDGRRGGPALWPRPFLPDMLDAQLNRVIQTELASPRIVAIDHEWKRLRLWSGLHSLRSRLVRDHEARFRTKDATLLTALLPLAARARREQLNGAIGYSVTALPADRRLNAYQPPAEDAAEGPLKLLRLLRIPIP